ncbi:hypothetical protein RclHR1_30820002 [Rhizophagus clarus]|uniref:HAT C-terminal dimerisation domain-containing protein n=1 Tax=Rhizophagus clarus TaxID=94130 RepID=A0A2Z6RMG2_9GLOM|nr:hypothetical protein RclHR1_30820002 [Rhizophagus clarus]
MVHPYMCMLKQMFAPRANENETIESYLELIYRLLILDNEEENAEEDIDDSSSAVSSDDDIPTAGNQHWQYMHQRQSQGQGRGQSQGRGRGHGRGCGCGCVYPRMKSFLFVEDSHREEQKTQAESLLSNLYTQLKHDLELPEEVRSPILDDDDDIFERMYASNQQLTQTGNDNNEIMCYLRCLDEPKSTDPLVWWRDHRSSYPILSKLA